MADFDPDAYLQSISSAPAAGTSAPPTVFDPDKYLASVVGQKQSEQIPDTRKPSGLTLFMDPSKFGAVAHGLSETFPQGPNTGSDSILKQTAEDALKNPNYDTAGNVAGTTLFGALGGVEGNTVGALAKNAVKAGAMADISQGGAQLGQKLTPGSPIGPIIGGLAAPLSAAGAMGALRSGGMSALSKLFPEHTADTQALSELSQQYGIPLSMGDLAGQEGKGVGGLERVLEKTPLSGMVKFRAGQQAAIQSKAPQILDTFAKDIPKESIEDPQNALQTYLGNAEKTARSMATEKYNDFLGKASQADAKVPITGLKAAAQNIVNQESQLPNEMQISAINTAKSILGLPDELGIKVASVWDKRLGGLSNAAAKKFNMGNVTKEDLGAYTALDQALGNRENGDIAQFAKTQPEDIVGSYNDAKDFYAQNVGPYNDPDIRKLGSDRFDTDTLLTKMVKNNRPQLAEKLMATLPQEGQSTLKYAVLNKLMESANYGSDTKPFSPKQFAGAWSKLGDTQDAIFSPEEKEMINGYTKLINAAPEPMANPRTGAENTGLLAAFGAGEFVKVAGVKAAIPLLFGGRALTGLLTSPVGQRLLMTAAETNDEGLLARLAQSAAATVKNAGSNPGTASAVGSKISPSAAAPISQSAAQQ